jgi:phosphoglucomutase
MDIYEEHGLYRESLANIYRKGKEGAEEIRQMMEKFRESPPEKLGGSRVIKVHDYLLQKSLDKQKNTTLPITLPKSNVLQYLTEDCTKVSIRPSGTEPKIKFYFSVKGKLGKKENYEPAVTLLDEKIERIKKELGIT